MKAFTAYQPYAYAIVAGLKGYETRPRRTNIRGRVAVHAGKGRFPSISMAAALALPKSPVLHYGAVLGTVEIVDCLPTDEFHGWACEITGGACMFVVPDSKRCAAVYGEGPDAVEPPEWEKFIKQRFERRE